MQNHKYTSTRLTGSQTTVPSPGSQTKFDMTTEVQRTKKYCENLNPASCVGEKSGGYCMVVNGKCTVNEISMSEALESAKKTHKNNIKQTCSKIKKEKKCQALLIDNASGPVALCKWQQGKCDLDENKFTNEWNNRLTSSVGSGVPKS